MSTDPATARLGQVLVIGAIVRFVAHLAGVRGDPSLDLVAPILGALGASLAMGQRWARTVLIVLTYLLVLVGLLVVIVGLTSLSLLFLALGLLIAGLGAAQMVALAFTVPDGGPVGGVPERWRPWATGAGLHLALLLSFLVAAVT